MSRATVYLTLDVEPDYGRADSCRALDQGDVFLAWLRGNGIPLTAFVVGRLLERGHRLLDELLGAGIPVALHGYSHAPVTFGSARTPHGEEISRGLDAYRRRVGRAPRGYRGALGILSREDVLALDRLGFRYDASVFPMRRPGRYDYSRLPRSAFRWQDTGLLEIPFGLLSRWIPAGMTFINLAGAAASAHGIRRALKARHAPPDAHPLSRACVLDMHLHNFFPNPAALRAVPPPMRLIYRAGDWRGGLRCLEDLTGRLRRMGFEFGCLEADALSVDVGTLPTVAPEALDAKG
jgi:peptidoglycan/xylan/chitin deacetylase (PgdA/CDA1 family)